MAINQTAFPNIATPTLKKTSLSFKNFGANSDGVNPVEKLSARVKQVEITNDALVSQNRDFQSSLSNINSRIGALESGQKAILDFQKDKAKIEKRQRKLEEQRIKREGAEGALEKDDADAIKKTDGSVEKKGKESVGFLDGIKRFFMFTIAGWFADKSMKLINAFASGNKDAINSIGKKLLGGLAAVGGLMLIAAAGIGPVLAGIGSLIGVLAGLLFNPVTLTALLIAVGIGGAIVGIRALWKWGTNKATGGQKFTDRHKELDQRLRDAGMTSKGLIVNESGMGKHTNRTEEQERILKEVQAERDKLNAAKKSMNDEVNAARKEYFKEIRANEPPKGDARVQYWKDARADFKIKENAIRKKYTDTITSSAGNGESISPKTNAADVTSKIGPEPNNEGKVTVVPMQRPQASTNSGGGRASSVPHIASGNPNNMNTLASKIQYNVPVG